MRHNFESGIPEGVYDQAKAPDVGQEIVESKSQLEGYKEYLESQGIVNVSRVETLKNPGFHIGEVSVVGRKGPVSATVGYTEQGSEFAFTLYHPETGFAIGEITGELLRGPDNVPARNTDKREYPGFSDAEQWPKVYVTDMKNETHGSYSGVGTALYQLAMEHSFRTGCSGRVQAKAGAIMSGPYATKHDKITSAGFHEAFGFSFQDVKDEDGTVLSRGSDVHEALAVRRYEAMKGARHAYAQEPPGEEKDKNVMELYRFRNRLEFPYDKKIPMFLSTEIITREWERVRKNPIIVDSAATVEALLQKQERLQFIEFLTAKVGKDGGDTYDQENLAKAYLDVGNISEAIQAYRRALELHDELYGKNQAGWEEVELERYKRLNDTLAKLTAAQ